MMSKTIDMELTRREMAFKIVFNTIRLFFYASIYSFRSIENKLFGTTFGWVKLMMQMVFNILLCVIVYFS